MKNQTLLPLNLKCNYLNNPLGIETPIPRFSWELDSNIRGERQTAYHILVAGSRGMLDNDKGDLWDSGYVKSDESIHIHYAGKSLNSEQKCYWKVRVRDGEGSSSLWSESAFWEMGLLKKEDWQARWIGNRMGGIGEDLPMPAPHFRKVVQLQKKVVSARAYICGLGYYELYINGNKIGDDLLSPAFTRYDKTVLYNTYDLGYAFTEGENVIGVILGNGWYNCFTSEVWDFKQAAWRDQPKLLLQVHIYFEDGEELVVITDDKWKTSTGPILFDGLRNGEVYDARLEKYGWNLPGYDDSSWRLAIIAKPPGGTLRSQQMTPIKMMATISPIDLKEVRPDVWVYDIGQNISGWAQLKVEGHTGAEVVIKYAEKLKVDTDIDTSNIDSFIKSGEFQTDRYILKGQGIEVWEPRFAYHGFRYVQVTGFPGKPTLDNIEGRVVHTAFESLGEFSSSNELFNAIQSCVRWSTLGNYHGMPTDCPHREKNGWTGDAQLSAEQVLLNFNPMTAYTKWMRDFKDVQRISGQLPGIVPTGGWGFNWGSGPAWDSAIILIPWYMYIYCADKSIIEEMYDSMKLYVDFMTSMAVDHIVDFGLGDWCPPTGGPTGHKCPTVVTDSAYYYVDAVTVAKVAELIGNAYDAYMYGQLALKIREAFRERFIDKQTGQVTGDCQTSMACALYQGLVDEGEQEKVLSALINEIEKQHFHIDCGILGAKYAMHSLTDLGRADLAYRMANQTTFPSWGHWISQGATTLWETWNGDASRNHHMFSDIGAWFYKGLAGINPDPDNPGFRHVIIRPNPVGDLKWVYARHRSMYGWISVRWEVQDDCFKLDVDIPANCGATIYMPAKRVEEVYESGKPVEQAAGISIGNQENGRLMLHIGSGEYAFCSMNPG